ncbi:MAG TPA: hypothetical protein DEO32_05115 [Ruminococcaceae bacterium]|nr:hypothetical protein [Oscillospiraceae bacterium]
MEKSSAAKKKKAATPPSQSYGLANVIANYFILVMFVLFPLFVNLTFDGSFPFLHFDRGYYGIRHQKYYLFMVMAAITVIAEILLLFTEGTDKIKNKYDLTSKNKIIAKLSFTDWAVLAFVFTAAISTIFSAYKEMAFFGEVTAGGNTHGRNNGLLLFLAYAAIYFVVSRAYRYREHIFVALSVTSAAVYLLAVLNSFYIDPLNMFALFKDDHKILTDFLTTIGNKNMFSTYICVTLPVAFTMSVCTKKLGCKIIYLVSAALGVMAVIVCDSDSAVLGIAAFLAVLLVVYSRDISKLKKYFLGVSVMIAAAKLLGIISRLANDNHNKLEAIPYKIMHSDRMYIVLAALVLITVSLYVLDYKKPGIILPKAVPIVIASVMAAAVLAVIGTMIYFSAVDTKTDLGSLERVLRFNKAWGTHRGVMWIDSMKIFGDASIFEKLFGSGPESFYFKFQPYFPDLYEFGDGSTDAAHNEYIQYLINVGVLGLASYLAFAGSALTRGLKSIKHNPVAAAYAAAVVAYLAQAFVNIALPIGTPLFIIFAAMCENAARQRVFVMKDSEG